MEEIQGIVTVLAGLVGLGLMAEVVRAAVWCIVIRIVFRKVLKRIAKR